MTQLWHNYVTMLIVNEIKYFLPEVLKIPQECG